METREYKRQDFVKMVPELIRFENACFPPELCMDESELKECLDTHDVRGVMVLDCDRLAAMTYGNDYGSIDKDWFDGHWDPDKYKKFRRSKSFYVTSTAVDPNYRGKGLALQTRAHLCRILKQEGYRYVVGHAHKGMMLKIVELFEGTIIEAIPRWYGSKQTHYFYEMELNNLPQLHDVPKVIQELD